jgi:hypothetical protein
MDPSVESFTAIRISRVRELPSLYIVGCPKHCHLSQRSTLAHSEEAMDGSFPMSYWTRQWRIAQTEVLAQEDRGDGVI